MIRLRPKGSFSLRAWSPDRPGEGPDRLVMTHKYRGSIVVLSISKSVEPNEEQKEMTSGFQQGILCKH